MSTVPSVNHIAIHSSLLLSESSQMRNLFLFCYIHQFLGDHLSVLHDSYISHTLVNMTYETFFLINIINNPHKNPANLDLKIIIPYQD